MTDLIRHHHTYLAGEVQGGRWLCAECGELMSWAGESRKQKAESRKQKWEGENRKLKTESRNRQGEKQKTENRKQKIEMGDGLACADHARSRVRIGQAVPDAIASWA
jgi:hypothetical protein